MGRLDRYVFGRLVRAFGFFALVLIGIYWLNRVVLLLDRYLGEGQSGGIVWELTLLSLPGLMLIVLPIAGFVAAIYATNRLLTDSELVVVQATGYSAVRLARSYLVFGVALTLVMAALAHILAPLAMARLDAREAEIAQAASARILVPGNFESPTRGVTVYVREIAPDGTVRGLMMTDRREVRREVTYTAARARLIRDADGPKLIMFDGMAQIMELPQERLAVTRFADFTVALSSVIDSRGGGRLDQRGLGTAELFSPSPETLEATRRSADDLAREAHLRISQPLLAAAAVVAGYATLMLGGFSRFGLWRQITLAVGLVILIKLIDNAAIDLARNDPAMWPAVYAAPLVGGLICVLLLVIADSGHRVRRLGRALPGTST